MQPDLEYQDHLKQGRFAIQRSRSSNHYIFYPRIAEPGTGDQDLEWVEASGLGVVYSTTTIYPKPPAAPYNVALVDLEEGPRLMTRVDGVEPETVVIGMRVKARIVGADAEPYVVFEPV